MISTERLIIEWFQYSLPENPRLSIDALIGLTNREPHDVESTVDEMARRGYIAMVKEYQDYGLFYLTDRGGWRWRGMTHNGKRLTEMRWRLGE